MKKNLTFLIIGILAAIGAVIISCTPVSAQKKIKSTPPVIDRYTPLIINTPLTPIDTSYCGDNGEAFQIINMDLTIDKKKMRLTIKNYYDGKSWSFRSMELKPYWGFATSTISSPNYQLTPFHN